MQAPLVHHAVQGEPFNILHEKPSRYKLKQAIAEPHILNERVPHKQQRNKQRLSSLRDFFSPNSAANKSNL